MRVGQGEMRHRRPPFFPQSETDSGGEPGETWSTSVCNLSSINWMIQKEKRKTSFCLFFWWQLIRFLNGDGLNFADSYRRTISRPPFSFPPPEIYKFAPVFSKRELIFKVNFVRPPCFFPLFDSFLSDFVSSLSDLCHSRNQPQVWRMEMCVCVCACSCPLLLLFFLSLFGIGHASKRPTESPFPPFVFCLMGGGEGCVVAKLFFKRVRFYLPPVFTLYHSQKKFIIA